jgi:hypothetical protein
MKTLTMNGVPYDSSPNGDTTTLYIYSSDKKVAIGSTNSSTNVLNLTTGWSELPETVDWLRQYRLGLKEATAAALKKAAEIQQVS